MVGWPIYLNISLAWPDRFFPFLFVVAEKSVWSGSHTHLILTSPTVAGVITEKHDQAFDLKSV